MNLTYPHEPGHRHTDTSEAAAEKVKPKAERNRAKVYAKIKEYPNGLTADECANLLHMGILQVRPRVTELARLGHVVATKDRRKNDFGNSMIVWKATGIRHA